MMRRVLGPTGGPILFLLVAALVFGVLGWVTNTAFQVEHAQREAAARAELGSNLRVALWRLDGRMLPALGVEYSRPYYQYGPADPILGYGIAATPLLTTNLPDWMMLHFQLDAASGWSSPQVLTDDAATQIQMAWPDLPLQNVNGERVQVLAQCQKQYPVADMLAVFTSRDRSAQPDMVAGAAPVAPASGVPIPDPPALPPTAPPTAQTAVIASNQAPDPFFQQKAPSEPKRRSYHLFGIEICVQPDPAVNNLALNQTRWDNNNNDVLRKNETQNQMVPNPSQAVGQQAQSTNRAKAAPSKEDGSQQGKVGIDNANRESAIKDRAIRDVQPPPQGNYPPRSQGIYGNNSYNPNSIQNGLQMPYDQRLTGNQVVGPMQGNTAPSSTPAVVPIAPLNPSMPGFGNPVVGPPVPTSPAVKGQESSATRRTPMSGSGYPYALMDDKTMDLARSMKADLAGKGVSKLLVEAARFARREADRNDKLGAEKTQANYKKAPTDELSALGVPQKLKDDERLHPSFNSPRAPLNGLGEKEADKGPLDRGVDPKLITPWSVPPAAAVIPLPEASTPSTPPAVGGAPLANHLGSMQPQWVIAPGGSEMLVLVRVAKVDNKDVCQGIILDWEKLEALLKDEVKDLFPNARLIPVKEGVEISPDRVMTALPVQLDPGPQPELPPAGLTTLRLGLLLAWAAAIIAFGAVGFCGWTLIDLAERRIRFVSAVTHELRTPLTSLRLYLDLLVSGMIQDEAKKQEYLNTLTVESDRLHRLIDNVLDFARLEKRRKDGDIKAVNVAELVEQLRRTWADRLSQEGRELVVVSTLPVGQEVKTDAAMIQQIVGNLIDNARKYSRDATDRRIWIWAKPTPVGKSVVIEVEDRGPGVPAGERRSIFKPFRRGEQADKTSGGAGLGLALAKSWAEVLGGGLSYRPAEGGTGACFKLELPLG